MVDCLDENAVNTTAPQCICMMEISNKERRCVPRNVECHRWSSLRHSTVIDWGQALNMLRQHHVASFAQRLDLARQVLTRQCSIHSPIRQHPCYLMRH